MELPLEPLRPHGRYEAIVVIELFLQPLGVPSKNFRTHFSLRLRYHHNLMPQHCIHHHVENCWGEQVPMFQSTMSLKQGPVVSASSGQH